MKRLWIEDGSPNKTGLRPAKSSTVNRPHCCDQHLMPRKIRQAADIFGSMDGGSSRSEFIDCSTGGSRPSSKANLCHLAQVVRHLAKWGRMTHASHWYNDLDKDKLLRRVHTSKSYSCTALIEGGSKLAELYIGVFNFTQQSHQGHLFVLPYVIAAKCQFIHIWHIAGSSQALPVFLSKRWLCLGWAMLHMSLRSSAMPLISSYAVTPESLDSDDVFAHGQRLVRCAVRSLCLCLLCVCECAIAGQIGP